MASVVHPVKLCLRAARQRHLFRLGRPSQPMVHGRGLSTTPPCRARTTPTEPLARTKDQKPEPNAEIEGRKSGGRGDFEDEDQDDGDEATGGLWDFGKEADEMEKSMAELSERSKVAEKLQRDSFWNDEELDTDYIADETGDDDFEENDITAMSHGKLEEHREAREYARLAVWDMPLLSKLAKPFEAPSEEHVLRFRYTSYLGEFHPAEAKVVVEFSPLDLPLSEAQQLKLMKLAGPRYNPEKKLVKMSCDMFEHQAQNKRYLGDLVDKLIAEAKNPAEMFDDVPLDTRHHKVVTKPKFPLEWRMSEERRKVLSAYRMHSFYIDQAKVGQGQLVDGKERVAQAHAQLAAAANQMPRELLSERVARAGALFRRPIKTRR